MGDFATVSNTLKRGFFCENCKVEVKLTDRRIMSTPSFEVELSETSSFMEQMANEGMEGMDPLMTAACLALVDEALAEGAEAYGVACGFSEETVTHQEVAELKQDAERSKMCLEKVRSVHDEE